MSGMLAGHVTALFRYRFVFTQDRLLTPAEFVREANDRDCKVTAAQLRRWHQTGWLRPLFFISDDAEPGLDVRVPPERVAGVNAAGDAATAAREGRLRDGSDVPFDAAPHDPSRVDRVRSRWLYSEWQLLDVCHLPSQPAGAPMESARSAVARARLRTVALCHASWWALPTLLDSVRLPDGSESYGPWTAAANAADPAALLDEAMWTVTDLRDEAERLLLNAHHDDPNREWLALVRHMSPQWWRRLHGSARDAAERRIAAEILLAAYERLAMRGQAQPLPDLSGAMARHPLHDRLIGSELDRTPLDRALAEAGLSPHPRAVLLVEGESEAIAARLLLTELVSEARDWVRVHTLGGAKADPKMLARFAAAPAIATSAAAPDDTWSLARPPTALVVHVDPEGRWDSPGKVAREQERIIDALDAEVRSQGAAASRQELATLIRIDVAPPGGFEYANFTDDELAAASASLSEVAATLGPSELAARFATGRRGSGGINRVLGQLRIRKPRLSAALAPLLIVRLPDEVANGATTPIIRAVLLGIDVATSMPRGHVVLTRRSR
jgi:hypothetical protein